MDWIDLAQDSVQWRALLSTVMDLLVTKTVWKFYILEWMMASVEGLSSLESVI
jgi:hypothetical protein